MEYARQLFHYWFWAVYFLPVNFTKFATGDTWLFGVQLMSLLLMVLFLKQPLPRWKWSLWGFIVMGALIHPLSMFIWSIGLWGYYQIFHPLGKNLRQLNLLFLLAILYASLWYFDFIQLDLPIFFMGIGSAEIGQFFLLMLIGTLPWFGFLPAAIWDMFNKLKRKEEMAIITSGWVLFGIFSQSMIVFAGLSFIIAKQLLAFFQKNYPYGRWVKGAALLNLVFTFVALTIILLSGFFQFERIGFRAVLGVSAIYWMTSSVAVLGLFLRSNRLVTGGMALSGLMFTWLFWLQANPLVDSQRDFPKKVFNQLKSVGLTEGEIPIYVSKNDSIILNKKKS